MGGWTAEERRFVLLSMQRALWEVPTADLRGVAVGPDADGAVVARFFYDGPVTDLHRELISLAETYHIADYSDLPTTSFEGVEHRSPAPLDLGGVLTWWIYRRWEPEHDRPTDRPSSN